MGTTRRLKEHNPAIQGVSFQPDSPFHGLEGLKHMASAIVPAIYNPHLADRELEVETEAAYEMAKRLAREEGLLVGISAAAAVSACVKIAHEEAAAGRRAVIVTVLAGFRREISQRAILGGSMSDLHVPRAVYESLRAHGEETYPHECCGALLGNPLQEGLWKVAVAVRAGNTRTDSAHNRYHIAPVELVKIRREARTRGP